MSDEEYNNFICFIGKFEIKIKVDNKTTSTVKKVKRIGMIAGNFFKLFDFKVFYYKFK